MPAPQGLHAAAFGVPKLHLWMVVKFICIYVYEGLSKEKVGEKVFQCLLLV